MRWNEQCANGDDRCNPLGNGDVGKHADNHPAPELHKGHAYGDIHRVAVHITQAPVAIRATRYSHADASRLICEKKPPARGRGQAGIAGTPGRRATSTLHP